MGTVIQSYRLTEADYRGERLRHWPKDLKGNNDLLVLTRPEVIGEIHRRYLEAGADIIETNTFNASAPSQADYAAESLVREINLAAAQIARRAADEVSAHTGRQRFVAGALGPTSRTASLSPDVNDPAYRNVSFDELAATYGEATRALVEGGVDLIMVETIFDTLNAKAALFAVRRVLDELGMDLPSGMHARPSSGSTARSARGSCVRTSRNSPGSPMRTSARTRMPACRTPSASTTRPPARRPNWSASTRPVASSISWVAAAARRPSTSRTLPRRFRDYRRGGPPCSSLAAGCLAWSRSTSAPTACS